MTQRPANREIAALFGRLADLIELEGGDHFKVQAYRKGRQAIADLDEEISGRYRNGRLEKIPGLGPALSRKVVEYLETGRIGKLDEVSAAIPDSLKELLDSPGMTPRVLHRMRRELGVTSLEGLREALADGRFMALTGLGRDRKEEIARGVGEAP